MDYTHTISTSSADLGQALAAAPFSPCFIVGYVSPHLDLDKITKIVQRSFPQAKLLLCSTAGELCNSSDAQLYCDTPDGWDNIVLQFLSAQMVERVEVISVPLECADLKSGTSSLDMADRIMRLQKSIETASRRVLMPIDYRDTLAYIVFDGLSASESFFMEALYATNKFPCLFIGGSAGGKLDFQNTWVHDGQSMLQGHATIAFLKLPPDIRFGVFKSQNFEETGPRFRVKSGSTELRFVQDVKTHNNETMPL
ncbi:MAG: FIST N-terminal domain-containing protein, partial [Alphaproteobacteria bacterium]